MPLTILPHWSAAHLQAQNRAARQVPEIVALQDHVVEFEEGHRLFAFEPQLHRIEREHAVDGEMGADFLQKLDVAKLAQPVVVVDHHRVGRPVAESQQFLEDRLDRGDVGLDRLVAQHLAAFVAPVGSPMRVVPPPISTIGLCPACCKAAQHHDLHKAADVQRWRGGIEADIARHDLLRRQGVEPSASVSWWM
jgi:hypothetical protein